MRLVTNTWPTWRGPNVWYPRSGNAVHRTWMAGLKKPTREWTLWVVALSCGLHATEEFVTGWIPWARETLGIEMPASRFFVMNGILVGLALRCASIGWRRPALSLVIPGATLVNAVFFHI